MPEISLAEAIRNKQSTLRALLVGVNDYKYLRPLNCSVSDCQELEKTLKQITQVFEQPKIYAHHDLSVDRHLTRESIEQSLDELLNAPQTDILLIYFSGHGVLSKKNNELYLCLPDTKADNIEATALNIQLILKRLKASNIGYQVVILDACHSGGVTLSPKGLLSKDAGSISRSVNDNDNYEPAGELEADCADGFEDQFSTYQQEVNQETQNFHAFLSCSSHQKSWELPNMPHGAFTYALIQELSDPRMLDEDGFIRLESLAGHIQERTINLVYQSLGQRQTPRYLSNSGSGIIIGKIDKKTIQPDLALYDDSLPAEVRYRKAYERAISKYYPTIPSKEINQLNTLSLQWRLLEREKVEIEKAAHERYRSYIERYQQNLKHRIELSRENGDGIFLSDVEIQEIREYSHVNDENFISANVLNDIDEEIRATYVDGYRQRYRKILYLHGLSVDGSRLELNASLEDRLKLEDLREDLKLTPENASQIADDEKECFQRDLRDFEVAIVLIIYQNGIPIDVEQVESCRGELSDRVIRSILAFQIRQFDQNREQLQQCIRHLKHDVRDVTPTQVQNCQAAIQIRSKIDEQILQGIEFGETVIQSILEGEEDYLQESIAVLRQQLEDYTKGRVDLLKDEDVVKFQTTPPLGQEIWKPILQEMREIHQQRIEETMRLLWDESLDESTDAN